MAVLTLIRTAPSGSLGSMAAYAGLVSGAVRQMKNRPFDLGTCDFFDPDGGESMRHHHLWRITNGRRFFAAHPSDVYYLLDGSMAAFLPSNVWKKTIVTVHDLIPLLQMRGVLPGRPGFAGRQIIRRGLRMLSQAAGIAAVSEHTKNDLIRQIGRSDISVVHNPVRPLADGTAGILPAGSDQELQALPKRFIFHIGNNASYKNRAGVLDVFSRLQDIKDLHLIMAGPSPTAGLKRSAEQLERVHFIVNPSDTELSFLYKKASAFLFPSLYEGFGLPVLEAMQAGCPVVCPSAASLPEVAGDAALMVDPGDSVQLAAHCRSIVEDSPVRTALIEKGILRSRQFSMERFTESLQTWIMNCIAERKSDAV